MANIHSREWVNPQDSEVPNRSRCYPKPVHLLPDRQWEKGLLLSTSTTNHHSIDITSKRPWVHAFLFILASTVQGGQWKTSCFFFLSFYYLLLVVLGRASLVAQMVKRLPAMWETRVWSLCWEDLLEKEMATHSSILAWRIPRMEEHGRLQSMGSQRVGHNRATSLSLCARSSLLSMDFSLLCFSYGWGAPDLSRAQ